MQTQPALSSTLQNEISALTERLSPSGADEVAKCINALLDRGFMVPSSVSDEFTLDLYRDALAATPIEGLRRAFLKLKQGDYPEYVDFMPKPAALASLANTEAKSVRAERARMSERMRTIRENAALGVKNGKHTLLKNVGEDARRRAEELARSGWYLVENCPSQESWVARVKKGLPVGAVFLYAIGEIWAPPAIPAKERTAA